MTRTLITIESARAGIHGAYSYQRSPNGGGTSSSFSGNYGPAIAVLTDASRGIEDGTWIIAKATVPNLVSAVIRGPMLDTSIDDDAVDPFTVADATAGRMVLEGVARGGSAGLAALAIAEPSAFDGYGVARYARWWHAKGARVGRLYPSRDAVEWLDGTVGTLADAAAALDSWRDA